MVGSLSGVQLPITAFAVIFAFLAEPITGNSIQLWLGTLFLLLPKALSITVAGKLPKNLLIHRLLPKGALKINELETGRLQAFHLSIWWCGHTLFYRRNSIRK